MALAPEDEALIETAREAIRRRYRPGWHAVGVALRTRAGKIVTGVNLDAYIARAAICAEAVALGRAITEHGDDGIDMVVAVRHPRPEAADQTLRVISPCGLCRELISDYDPKARVLVPTDDVVVPVAIGELLPNKYQKF